MEVVVAVVGAVVVVVEDVCWCSVCLFSVLHPQSSAKPLTICSSSTCGCSRMLQSSSRVVASSSTSPSSASHSDSLSCSSSDSLSPSSSSSTTTFDSVFTISSDCSTGSVLGSDTAAVSAAVVVDGLPSSDRTVAQDLFDHILGADTGALVEATVVADRELVVSSVVVGAV